MLQGSALQLTVQAPEIGEICTGSIRSRSPHTSFVAILSWDTQCRKEARAALSLRTRILMIAASKRCRCQGSGGKPQRWEASVEQRNESVPPTGYGDPTTPAFTPFSLKFYYKNYLGWHFPSHHGSAPSIHLQWAQNQRHLLECQFLLEVLEAPHQSPPAPDRAVLNHIQSSEDVPVAKPLLQGYGFILSVPLPFPTVFFGMPLYYL